MSKSFTTRLFLLALSVSSQLLFASPIIYYNVTVDTAPLVGHPAGPFYLELAFTDGSGYGDGNNTATLNNFSFGGGSALGNPIVFGGTTGSLEAGVSITDTSFLSLFSEQFAPGLQMTFSLGLTSNDDADGIPDGLTLYILDSSGVAVPTLAPSGNYFLSAALGSTGAVFSMFGSDPSQSLSVGNPVSIPAPTVAAVSSTPEPSMVYLLGAAIGVTIIKSRYRQRC